MRLCKIQDLYKNILGHHKILTKCNHEFTMKQKANVTSALAWSINRAHSSICDMISVSGRSSMLSVL